MLLLLLMMMMMMMGTLHRVASVDFAIISDRTREINYLGDNQLLPENHIWAFD